MTRINDRLQGEKQKNFSTRRLGDTEKNINFKEINDLKSLPYFKINERGRLALDLENAPPIIDLHTHLGFLFRLAPPINLHSKTPNVKHNFPERRVPVDLSIESGINLGKYRHLGVTLDYARALVSNTGPNATYTIPNLLDEMDRMGVAKSAVLPVDLQQDSRNSDAYIAALAGHGRLLPFCAVNSRWRDWTEKMDEYVAHGARGLKVHPYAQQLPSDHPLVIRMLRRWNKTGLPVLFHTGYNGLEPFNVRYFATMKYFEKPIRKFPETTFILGHAGMDFYEIAIGYALKYENVLLEIDGQPPQRIQEIVERVGADRVFFGTDWPFFPIALSLAKTLIATEGEPSARRKILYENAMKLLSENS